MVEYVPLMVVTAASARPPSLAISPPCVTPGPRRLAAELVAQMDRDALEDLLIETDGRSPDDIVRRSGWLPMPPS